MIRYDIEKKSIDKTLYNNSKNIDISGIKKDLQDHDIEDKLLELRLELLKDNTKESQEFFQISDSFNKLITNSLLDECPYKKDKNVGKIFRDTFMMKLGRYLVLMRRNKIGEQIIFSPDGGLVYYFTHELEDEFYFKNSIEGSRVYKALYIEFSSYLLSYQLLNKKNYRIGRSGEVLFDKRGQIYLNSNSKI